MLLFWFAIVSVLWSALGKQDVLMQIYQYESSCENGGTPLYEDTVTLEFPISVDNQVCVNESDGVELDSEDEEAASRPLSSTSFSCVENPSGVEDDEEVSLIFVSQYATPDCKWDMITELLYVESGKCFYDNRDGQAVWTRWTWQGFCGQKEKIEDSQSGRKIKVCSKAVLQEFEEAKSGSCEEGQLDGDDPCECLEKLSDRFAEKANCYTDKDAITSLQQQIFICKTFSSNPDFKPCDGLDRVGCNKKRDTCLWYKPGEKCFDLSTKCMNAENKKECRKLDCYWSRQTKRCYTSANSLCPEQLKQSKCLKLDQCEWEPAAKRCCSSEYGCLQ